MTEKFFIKKTDFVYHLCNSNKHQSAFDEQFTRLWNSAMSRGYFWYSLDAVERKTIPGKWQMIVQLNEARFTNRRTPQTLTHVVMPFNKDKFHFNKIKPHEILLELVSCGSSEEVVCDKIIINVSPIDFGHALLIPNSDACLPQVLNLYGIEKATELCLLSIDPGFCIGFNSLCALASVNHFHFHMMYVKTALPITACEFKVLGDGIFVLHGYVVNTFAVQLNDCNIQEFGKLVFSIVKFLCDNDIAHNLLMCRCRRFDDTHQDVVTVFIFPKVATPDIYRKEFIFYAACMELSGYLIIGDRLQYDDLNEDAAISILKQHTYEDKHFVTLCERLMDSRLAN